MARDESVATETWRRTTTTRGDLRVRRDGTATRLRIIQAAERLYAERGIDGVTLRDIGKAAGQRNTTVVQYHFGGRDGLITAIFTTGSALVETLRAPLVAALPEEPAFSELAAAVVRPYAATIPQGSSYVSFLARLIADRQHQAPGADERKVWRASYGALVAALDRRLDHLPKAVRQVRSGTVVEFTVSALAAHCRAFPREPLARLAFDCYVDDLVDVVAGMLAAPGRA